MRRFGLFMMGVVVILAVQCCVSSCAQADVGVEFENGDEKFAPRPNADEGPAKVTVGFYILDIADIDDADQSFTADVFASIRWKDPRRAGKGHRFLKPEELGWYPEMMLLNKRAVTRRYEDLIAIAPDGSARYDQRFFGTFSFPLDLRDFPFDKHEIPIRFITAGQGPDEVELIVDESITGRESGMSVAGWIIGDVKASVDTYLFKPNNREFSMVTFTLDARRRAGFYIWRIMAPLTLIVFMSWMVFWIDPSHLEAQVGISATSILTLIAFQFTIGVLLPRLAYLTRLDLFVFFSSILVFLALVEGVTTSALASKGRRELALKVDAWSRVLFPSAFVTAILVSFVF